MSIVNNLAIVLGAVGTIAIVFSAGSFARLARRRSEDGRTERLRRSVSSEEDESADPEFLDAAFDRCVRTFSVGLALTLSCATTVFVLPSWLVERRLSETRVEVTTPDLSFATDPSLRDGGASSPEERTRACQDRAALLNFAMQRAASEGDLARMRTAMENFDSLRATERCRSVELVLVRPIFRAPAARTNGFPDPAMPRDRGSDWIGAVDGGGP